MPQRSVFPRSFLLGPLGALLVALTTSSPASADKLDDFREAVAAKPGCDSIPYSDHRSNCRSQQSEVHPWCDGHRGPVSCPGSTRDVMAARDAAQRELQAVQDKRRELESRRSNAADDADRARINTEIDAVDKQIDAARRSLEGREADLVRRRDHVANAIDTLDRCIDYRRAVMNVFAYVTDKVRSESDPDVLPYARQLRDKYPEAISGHEEAIANKTTALETCKKERP